MDASFTCTEQQDQWRTTIVEFARAQLNAGIIQRDHEAVFSQAQWRKCAALGLCGLPFPEVYGGGDLDFLSTVLSVEALAYACHDAGLVHAILTQLLTGISIRIFGSDEQKQRYLPPLCDGTKIVAQAATESDSGSDVFAMRTRAERGDGYVLNGSKFFISNGPNADFVLVLAATADTAKHHSMFIVERAFPGFRAGKPLMKMGLRTLLNSELVFEDCHVPLANLVGKEHQGSVIFGEAMEWERILIAAAHLGTMRRVHESCTAYAKSRHQFGQAIGKFQAVSTKIARMQMNAELARLMVYKAASLKDAG
ncbi:MAG: acyl-CoA dehydrogenase family protein, partial [Proteobacteria bacterium]|nr:acyl-CoA dehydrogenase family protein [Pseudomonadota bacterium]